MTMRLDGYVRVSRVGGREGDAFISPDVQRQRIEQWAALRGATIVEWHQDLDESGARMERPGLNQAIHRIRAGVTQGVVVAKMDRFARTLPGALETIARIDEAGGQVVSVDEGIDPSTPAGKAMQRLVLVFAEWTLDVIRDQWRTARQRAVARGVHVASRTPTGYRRDNNGRLAPDDQAAPVIRTVFHERAQGASWADLARLLDHHGVVGPYGARQWTPRAVSHLVRNRAYLGEARSGEFVNRRAHPPIVDRATFEAAQTDRAVAATKAGDPSLLAGLLRCAGCRYAMKPDRMTLRDGQRVRIYRCRGRHAAGTCQDRVAVLGHVIEPWVVERMLNEAGRVEAEQVGGTRELDTLLANVDAAEAELEAFRDDERIVGVLGPDRFVDGLKRRAQTLEDAQAALADAHARLRPADAPSSAELADVWPDLGVHDQRKLLRGVIDAVMVRSRIPGRHAPIGERALILWRGEMPDDFPRRGHRPALQPFDWPPDGAGIAGLHDARERGGQG